MTRQDLVKLWEEHVAHEFQTHDTEATLAEKVVNSDFRPHQIR